MPVPKLVRDERFRRRLARRHRIERAFRTLFLAAILIGVTALVLLLANVLTQGAAWLDWEFFTQFPSRFPERAGIKAAFFGSLWLIGLTALISVPVGVGAAIYLDEFARPGRLSSFIQTNIGNLAGVPSVVYGILGLAVFVRGVGLGRSLIAGAFTLSLVVLPIMIIASQEALRGVPDSIRRASLALGATRWQTVRHAVLPAALPGILTGVILALSRAIGETAPLIVVGALTYAAFVPVSVWDPFTALPIQIFNWTSRPQAEFHHVAAAAILVLLAVLLGMNALAIFLRNKYEIKFDV